MRLKLWQFNEYELQAVDYLVGFFLMHQLVVVIVAVGTNVHRCIDEIQGIDGL